MEKCTIVLYENEVRYKISKIIFYGNNGGFGLLAPYHKAKTGYLIKYHLDTATAKKEHIDVEVEESLEYSASDRVKLSIHTDGFVQFSGENPGKILSGRDPNTGEPKGLGLFIGPLSNPIMTGPTLGLQVWGLNQFEIAGPTKPGEQIIEYFEDDYEYRYADKQTWNSYNIEIFIFPPICWNFSFINERDQRILKFRHPMFKLHKDKTFTFRVLPFIDENIKYMIALLISREKIELKGSGFIMNPPAQTKDNVRTSMMAGYPSEVFPFDMSKIKSIDYKTIR
jgi:hypothetical protein